MSRFLEFVAFGRAPKKKFWVYSKKKGNILGKIEYYLRWRRYVFDPEPFTIYDVECMQDICRFINGIGKN